MYGTVLIQAQEKKLDVAEMRMLRCMSGITKLAIMNERIGGTSKVEKYPRKCWKAGRRGMGMYWEEKNNGVMVTGGAREKKARKTEAEMVG